MRQRPIATFQLALVFLLTGVLVFIGLNALEATVTPVIDKPDKPGKPDKDKPGEPDWQVEHAYLVDVQGQPCVSTRVQFYPGPDFPATTFQELMVIGMIATAMPAVNAIPAVVAAKPGIVTYSDLPLTTARGMLK